MAVYHEKRTVQWGHWGITFMDPNPNQSRNYGLIIGSVPFPVSTCGPFEGDKRKWQAMCAAWIADRTMPPGFVPATTRTTA
jgi:hypothetical protein